jgi:hypothetical protein
MNKQGVQNLIDQLEFFKDQLEDEQWNNVEWHWLKS